MRSKCFKKSNAVKRFVMCIATLTVFGVFNPSLAHAAWPFQLTPAKSSQLKCAHIFYKSPWIHLEESDVLKTPTKSEIFLAKVFGSDPYRLCCKPVKTTNTRFPETIHGSQDPYTVGATLISDHQTTSARFHLSKPSEIVGTKLLKIIFSQKDFSLKDRIWQFLESHPNYRLGRAAGEGTFSSVFFLRPGDSKTNPINPSQAPASPLSVVKFRWRNSPEEINIHDYFVRDLALMGVAHELTERATFDGQQFIRMAKSAGTAIDLSEGILIQEAQPGPSAFDLAYNLFKLRENGDPGAKDFLKKSGFDPEDEVVLHNLAEQFIALEQFYRECHNDVLRFVKKNNLPSIQNKTLSQTFAKVGFDFAHGNNIKWNSKERMWVIIDI